MLKKIAFLCVNPWEDFLLPTFHRYTKESYYLTQKQALLREDQLYCSEWIDPYGEIKEYSSLKLFGDDIKSPQLLYVQSSKKDIIKQVFTESDFVLVGMSISKKERDNIFLTILPWIEKAVFLWDSLVCDQQFLQQMQWEYKLKDFQIMETKRLPSYLTEALNS